MHLMLLMSNRSAHNPKHYQQPALDSEQPMVFSDVLINNSIYLCSIQNQAGRQASPSLDIIDADS